MRASLKELHRLQKNLRLKPLKPSRKAGRLTKPGCSPSAAGTAKYRNIRTGQNASRKESRRARELKLQEKAGLILNLREQVRFELTPRQYRKDGTMAERESGYIADFVYDTKWGKTVVEDCKGIRLPMYILKRKLMRFLHGIEVVEV